jgi:hypothetical protein
VIIGRRVRIQDVDFENHKYTSVGWTDWGEGTDIFDVTPEHWELWPYLDATPMHLWEDAEAMYDGGGKITLPGGEYEVEVGSATMHNSADMETFLENYPVVGLEVARAIVRGDKVPIDKLREHLNAHENRLINLFLSASINGDTFWELFNVED